MSALWKNEFIKKYVYLYPYLDTPMSADIAQAVEGTITVISEDIKMRRICNRIPNKSFSYPLKDFSISQQRINKRSCKREWLIKYPFVSYSKTRHGLFCLCCFFLPASAHQGQRAQNLIILPYKNWRKALEDLDKHATLSDHFTSMTKLQWFLETMEIPSSRIDNNISSNKANRIKENREYLAAILSALHYLGRQGLALRGCLMICWK